MSIRKPWIIGVPFDGGSSHALGCAHAPAMIFAYLQGRTSNWWGENRVDVSEFVAPSDFHMLSVSPGESPEEYYAELRDFGARALTPTGAIPLYVGGDHSITVHTVSAALTHYPKLRILHLDAHPDFYDVWDGDPFSHACPFARIAELDGIDYIAQVGLRANNDAQREVVEESMVRVDQIDMDTWVAKYERQPVGLAKDFLGDTPIYLSLDLDVLDPSCAPGVSHPEPGGMSVRDVLRILHAFEGAPIIGADIVEYNPRHDVGELTMRAAAKLVIELASIIASPR